jgi:hypothetical protein
MMIRKPLFVQVIFARFLSGVVEVAGLLPVSSGGFCIFVGLEDHVTMS